MKPDHSYEKDAVQQDVLDSQEFSTRTSMILGLKGFSRERWDQFALVYTPLLKCWIRHKGVPQSAVDDVLQESLTSIYSGIQNFAPSKGSGSFRGWLRTVVHRRSADFFRHLPQEFNDADTALRNAPQKDQKSAEQIADEELAMEEVRSRAMELVRQSTSERTWQMFWLSVIDQRPTAEIAAEFSVTQAAVRVAKQRVLKRLRAIMIEDFSN